MQLFRFVLPCILLLSGCSLGYRVSDDDLSNKRYLLKRGQAVHQRSPSGGLRTVAIDTSFFGSLYIARDTVFFDPMYGAQPALILVPTPESFVRSASPINLAKLTPDVDVITLPLRYRYKRGIEPGILVASTNLALYGGLRFDRYTIRYRQQLESLTRENLRMGFGAGIFAGLTPVNVSPDVDMPAMMIGVGAMLDVGGVSFGVAAGVDRLLQDSVPTWKYEEAVWIGIWLGLNLN